MSSTHVRIFIFSPAFSLFAGNVIILKLAVRLKILIGHFEVFFSSWLSLAIRYDVHS